jgi:hypothetical protein
VGVVFQVYVGPYIECECPRRPAEWVEEFESLVTEGQGETKTREDRLILIPNQLEVPGIERQLIFERIDGDVDPSSPDVISEVASFVAFANPVIEYLVENDIEYEVTWGIVPGWF